MKTRKRSRDDVPADDGGLETWLQDLVDGEITARRLRKRLDDGGGAPVGSCTVCAADQSYFGPGGHLHGRRTAGLEPEEAASWTWSA